MENEGGGDGNAKPRANKGGGVEEEAARHDICKGEKQEKERVGIHPYEREPNYSHIYGLK
jgi:hypothetical protein